MSKLIAKGIYQHGYDNLEFTLPVILFNEGTTMIAYCPLLDLSGYGIDETSAKDSFRIVLGEFINYALEHDTFESELKRLGWKVSTGKTRIRKVEMPDISNVFSKNPKVHSLMKHGSFQKYDERVSIPVH
ncbi:MAG TPA: hypothetical protein P5531_04290 [Bacteroidales bacterium]|nr:hypothetical protein [Bacteroidales bacterium]HSA42777.1 hypothetical protein [Bacteroidales bacterium]